MTVQGDQAVSTDREAMPAHVQKDTEESMVYVKVSMFVLLLIC